MELTNKEMQAKVLDFLGLAPHASQEAAIKAAYELIFVKWTYPGGMDALVSMQRQLLEQERTVKQLMKEREICMHNMDLLINGRDTSIEEVKARMSADIDQLNAELENEVKSKNEWIAEAEARAAIIAENRKQADEALDRVKLLEAEQLALLDINQRQESLLGILKMHLGITIVEDEPFQQMADRCEVAIRNMKAKADRFDDVSDQLRGVQNTLNLVHRKLCAINKVSTTVDISMCVDSIRMRLADLERLQTLRNDVLNALDLVDENLILSEIRHLVSIHTTLRGLKL